LKFAHLAKINFFFETQGKLKGLINVARISTQMGCLTTLCVVKNTDLPAVNEVLVSWAKPIIAAQQLKAHVGMEWRMQLEKTGVIPSCCDDNNSPPAVACAASAHHHHRRRK
jgi:hypothetical protein